MGLADLVPPVASSHGDDAELGQNDGPTDGSGYLLRALHTQTNTSVVIPDGDKRLEPGLLASTGLLLHRHDLQNLVLEGCPQEKVNDLRFPDGQRKETDLLQGLDLHVPDQAARLGDGEPLLVLGLASASSAASAPAPTATPDATPAPAPDAAAEACAEATAASHSRAPEASGASRITGVICHVVFLRKKSNDLMDFNIFHMFQPIVVIILFWLLNLTHLEAVGTL